MTQRKWSVCAGVQIFWHAHFWTPCAPVVWMEKGMQKGTMSKSEGRAGHRFGRRAI